MPITILIPALLILDSLHYVFARLLMPHVAPGLSAMLVLSVSTVEVGIFGFATRRIHWQTLKRYFAVFLAIGLLIAASTAIDYEAVAFIDPGTASLLSQMSVLFGLAFGLLWLRDRLHPRQIAGAVLALAGVFIISFQPGDYLRVGSLLVVSSALMYALHAALAKRYAGDIGLVDFFFYRLLFTSVLLFAFVAGRGLLVWPGPRAWGLIALTGTVDVVLSRTLYYAALRRLTISVHTLVLTLSPVASILWALALFRTHPTPQQILGGVAILAGVGIVSLSRPKQQTPAAAAPQVSPAAAPAPSPNVE